MNRMLSHLAVALAASHLLVIPAQASFHFWRINEIYSNADGSVQFVEFFTTSGSQQFLATQQLKCSNTAQTLTNTFTFPNSLPSMPSTADRFFLVATPGFAGLPGGIAPDYTFPTNFLFRPGGRLSLVGADTVTYTSLPTNGILSISRTGVTAINSPRNFGGQQGSIIPPNNPPSIAITNPPDNAVRAAPATVTLQASAMDTDGSVTNVQFFSGANFLGSTSGPPFNLTLSNLAAGNYVLTARAADNLGLMATSAPVNLSVVTPVPLSFSPPTLVNGQFQSSISTTPGLTYVVEASSNLPPIWVGFSTNVAMGNSLSVVDPDVASRGRRFFRAFLLP